MLLIDTNKEWVWLNMEAFGVSGTPEVAPSSAPPTLLTNQE